MKSKSVHKCLCKACKRGAEIKVEAGEGYEDCCKFHFSHSIIQFLYFHSKCGLNSISLACNLVHPSFNIDSAKSSL